MSYIYILLDTVQPMLKDHSLSTICNKNPWKKQVQRATETLAIPARHPVHQFPINSHKSTLYPVLYALMNESYTFSEILTRVDWDHHMAQGKSRIHDLMDHGVGYVQELTVTWTKCSWNILYSSSLTSLAGISTHFSICKCTRSVWNTLYF